MGKQKQEKVGLSWLDSRRTVQDPPHMELEARGFGGVMTTQVLKSHQPGNEAKTYARWLVAVQSPATHGMSDMGDTYVHDVILGARLVRVQGEQPTDDQRSEFRALQAAVVSMSWCSAATHYYDGE